MTDPTLELLNQINSQTSELVTFQKEFSTAVHSMAVTMARMEESHGFILREHASQKEVNESTNFKLSALQEDYHNLEKRIIELKSLPDSLDKNWASTRKIKDDITENKSKLVVIDKTLDSVLIRVASLETVQSESETSRTVVTNIGSWFVNKLLGPLLIGILTLAVAGAAVYFKGG